MKILIGDDGSDASHAAITDLRRAGLPDQATALVLSAADAPIVQPLMGSMAPMDGGFVFPLTLDEARQSAAREVDHARAIASTGAKRVAELFPGWTIQTASPTGPAYLAIVEQAKTWGADLVVVGSHGHSMIGRLFFGTVAQNVLSHAPCSVRISRGQDPNSDKPLGFPLRLLLGVDGSSGSIAAIEVVCARTWPAGTEVRLTTVADLRLALAIIETVMAADGVETTPRVRSPVERVVRAAGDRFRDSGLNVSTVVLEGDPKYALLREAERWRADCIFLGGHGHSRLERFLIGSVSASVASRAGCTVEVVRKPAAP